MTRARLFVSLLLLLAAPALFAASADLSVESTVIGIPIWGRPNDTNVDVTNHGPDVATNVVVTFNPFGPPASTTDGNCTQTGQRVRCQVTRLGPNETARFIVGTETFGNAGGYARLQANVTSDTPDPDPANNEHVLFFLPVFPPGEIRSWIEFPEAFDADGTLTVRYELENIHDDFPATVVAQISIPEATALVRTSGDCRAASGTGVTVDCSLTIPANGKVPLEITVRTPDPAGFYTTSLKVTWVGYPGIVHTSTSAKVYTRKILVTSTADSGAGSLRAAIEDANARCQPNVPCLIHFAIAEPVPQEGWFTIKPLTPLPPVGVPIGVFDARTQTAFSGDTNPLGPEVLLDGSALTAGSGFYVRGAPPAPNASFGSASTTIAGFAIGGFPENGIFAVPSSTTGFAFALTSESNYIGVDPTGTRAMPNNRGIMATRASIGILRNVIGGNRFSGVFTWAVHTMLVDTNRIGVAAATDDPIPNGASGVFIGSSTQGQFGRADFYRNVIANNGHFGIAYSSPVWVFVGVNRIENNHLGAVDMDLDGPSPIAAGVAMPRIERAYWDGESTVIEGTTPARVEGSVMTWYSSVLLYANTTLEPGGYAEAERHFGTVSPDQFGRFTLRYSGDLRGLYVNGMSAQTTDFYRELQQVRTSELGQAVLVTDGQ